MAKDTKLNIALVHLRENGDVLYATTIAKQIKEIDFPGCNLTWIVSKSCKKVLDNNPYIDQIIEIDFFKDSKKELWQSIKEEFLDKKDVGVYDEVFFTQIHPGNWHNFDGTVRSSIFNNYPFKIKTSIKPVMVLNSKEILNVKNFARENEIEKYQNRILFECTSNSNQSFINIDLSLEISKKILEKKPDTCIVLSSHLSITSDDQRIIDGSKLTYRENAELTKYCNLLIGCSSGITWLSTSTSAKQLPMLQLLGNDDENIFASVEYDFKYFKQDCSQVVEVTNSDLNYIVECLDFILNNGIEKAKAKFGESLKPRPDLHFDTTFYQLYKEKKYREFLNFIFLYYRRNKIIFLVLLRIIKIISGSIKLKLKKRFL